MNRDLPMRGALGVRPIRHQRAPLRHRLLNLHTLLRGYWRYQLATVCGIPTFYGVLRARAIKRNGQIVDYGVISTRAVTTAFANKLAAALVTADAGLVNFDFHASGTGTTAEAAANTTLVTPTADARVAGVASNPSANVYRSVATITYAAATAVTEHGIFDAATNGTLLDRSVFAVVNVAAGERIEFQYDLTVQSGG